MGVGGPPMKCTKCGGDQIEKMFPSRTDNGKTRRRKWCRNCKTRHSTTTRRQKHKDDPAFHEMQKKKCRESATIRGKELRLKALLHRRQNSPCNLEFVLRHVLVYKYVWQV